MQKATAITVIIMILFLLNGCSGNPNLTSTPKLGNTPTALSVTPTNFASDAEAGKAFVVDLFQNKAYDRMMKTYHYDQTLKDFLKPSVLQYFVEQMESKRGAFTQVTDIEEQALGGYTICNYTCSTETDAFTVTISFSEKHELVGFDFYPIIDCTPNEKGTPLSLGANENKLPGILLSPEKNPTNSIAIFLHGSGPQDYNCSTGLLKPYQDMAEALYDKGIATYRFYKRTYYYMDTIDIKTITPYEEVIADVLAIIEFFNGDDVYRFDNIYLIGHSQSGYLLPRIYKLAVEKGLPLSGLIFMGASYSPVEDLMVKQQKLYMKEHNSETDPSMQVMLEEYKAARDRIKNLNENSNEGPELLLGLNKYYYLYLKNYDPATEMEHIEVPCLMLFAGNDKNVDRTEKDLWEKKLVQDNVVIREYAGLNHLFVPGSGWLAEDMLKPGNVDSRVMEDIYGWIIAGKIGG